MAGMLLTGLLSVAYSSSLLLSFLVIHPTTTCLLKFLYTRLGAGVIRLAPEIPVSPLGISFSAVCDSVPVTCGSVASGDTRVPSVWMVH